MISIQLLRWQKEIVNYPKVNREGIVIRPVDPIQDPDFGLVSFKAINPNFLLKYDE